MEQQAGKHLQPGTPLQFSRPIPSLLRPPNFRLAGLAIGDGLTDPLTQVTELQFALHATLVQIVLSGC